MRAILVIGWKGVQAADEPHVIYCGLKGLEADKAAEAARQSGSFRQIGRLDNPLFYPRPAVPTRPPGGVTVPPESIPGPPEASAEAPKAAKPKPKAQKG